MIHNIDDLFEMLSWNSSEEIQEKALIEAGKVKHLSIFLQPRESKSVWENCAKILACKSDSELELYLIDLFQWLQDLNWPGALLIYERLKSMPSEFIRFAYSVCMEKAIQTKDDVWLQVLKSFEMD